MRRKQHTIQEIGELLRVAEARIDAGDTVVQACQALNISAATYYLWRRNYGHMTSHQLARFEEMDQTVAQLKKQVRRLSLDNAILQEALRITGGLTPAQKREIVQRVQERLNVSERCACAALSQPRCTQRYQSQSRP